MTVSSRRTLRLVSALIGAGRRLPGRRAIHDDADARLSLLARHHCFLRVHDRHVSHSPRDASLPAFSPPNPLPPAKRPQPTATPSRSPPSAWSCTAPACPPLRLSPRRLPRPARRFCPRRRLLPASLCLLLRLRLARTRASERELVSECVGCRSRPSVAAAADWYGHECTALHARRSNAYVSYLRITVQQY